MLKTAELLLFLFCCVTTLTSSDVMASEDQVTARLLFVDVSPTTTTDDVTITNCTCTRYIYTSYGARRSYESLRHDADRCACDVTDTSRITEHALVVAADASQHWIRDAYEFVVVCSNVINQTLLDDVIVPAMDNGHFSNFKSFNCNYTTAVPPVTSSPSDDAAVVYGLHSFSVYDEYDALVTSWLLLEELDPVSFHFLLRNHVVMVHWSTLLPGVMSSSTFKAFSFVIDDVATTMTSSEPVSAALRRVEGSDFVTDDMSGDFLVTVIYVD